MDPRHTGDMFKHLEKQNELLMEAYSSMSHELHKLQVEEEMLMRKFYELMAAIGVTKKNGNTNVSVAGQIRDSTSLHTNRATDSGEIGESTAIIPTNTDGQQ